MGFDMGDVSLADVCFKRKHRWLFIVDGVCGEGIDVLPPFKSARPNLSFKELEIQGVSETIYRPMKPEYKAINLVLYDIVTRGEHPVFRWLKQILDAKNGQFVPNTNGFYKQAELVTLNGCGDVIETWVYENIWPQTIEFGDLDMSTSDVVTCDLTLRYDRGYINEARVNPLG